MVFLDLASPGLNHPENIALGGTMKAEMAAVLKIAGERQQR